MKAFKTIFLALCMAALIPSVHAQKTGIRAGVNYAQVSGDGFDDTKTMTGFHVGVFREVTLVPELVFLEPEVQYSMQGFKANDTDYTIGYINIPVLAKVYIVKLISLEAGPQVGFKINDNFPNDTAGGEVKINTVDMGIAGGIGLNFPLGLSVNLRFIQGFTDIVDDVDGKNQVLQIGAAFKF